MDADEFRDYILGFIFYKYLSEKMQSYADGLLAEDGGGFSSSRTRYLSEEGYINNAMDSELMVADSGEKYKDD